MSSTATSTGWPTSGVTKGCNPPENTEFCPDDFVTREQMSAFMHRLDTEGVFLPADGTATNADQVDGKDASAFLGATETAVDADRLDGNEAGAFEDIFAVVQPDSTGVTVLAENGLVNADRGHAGSYNLTWDRDVSDCAWTATVGARDGEHLGTPHNILLNGTDSIPRDIRVRIVDDAGNDVEIDFNVAVDC